MHRWPTLEWFVLPSSPVRKFGVNHDIRLKIERESGSIFETDVDEEIFWGNVDFDALDSLAFRLGEGQNAPVCFLSNVGTVRL